MDDPGITTKSAELPSRTFGVDAPDLAICAPLEQDVMNSSCNGGDNPLVSSPVGAATVVTPHDLVPNHPVYSHPYLDHPRHGPPGSPSYMPLAPLAEPATSNKPRMVALTYSAGIPCEVAGHIGRYGGVRERGTLVRVSRAFYWGVAPWLYKNVSITSSPVNPSSKKYPAYHVLTCLLRPLVHRGGVNRTRENLETIKVFSYTSNDAAVDYLALPLLADVLRFCTSLQELRIHTARDTVNVLLDTFLHHGIVAVRPLSLFQAVVEEMQSSVPTMSKLNTLHVSDAHIGAALTANRRISTVVVDRPLADEDLPSLLPVTDVGAGIHVTRLSVCVLGGNEALEVVLLAIARGFPSLEHFAMRTIAFNINRLVEVSNVRSIRFSHGVDS